LNGSDEDYGPHRWFHTSRGRLWGSGPGRQGIWPGGTQQDRPMPLRALRKQAVLRWRPQERELPEHDPGFRPSASPASPTSQTL